jgi:hypothetical protein
MNIILHNLIRKRTIEVIEDLGDGIQELIIDIELSFGTVHSIESFNKQIIVHVFKSDLDLTFDFDDLKEQDKFRIWKALKAI